MNRNCRGMIGPRNTISNLAYAVVGTYLAWKYQDSASAALGVALWVLATGSALYHAQKTLRANRLDWVGMYMVAGALVAHGLVPRLPGVSWAMLAVGGAWVAYYGHQRWMSADWHIALAMVLGSIRPALSGHLGVVGWAWLAFAVAYGAWHLDKAHSRWVGKYGHAAWHVLTAVAIGLCFIAQQG